MEFLHRLIPEPPSCVPYILFHVPNEKFTKLRHFSANECICYAELSANCGLFFGPTLSTSANNFGRSIACVNIPKNTPKRHTKQGKMIIIAHLSRELNVIMSEKYDTAKPPYFRVAIKNLLQYSTSYVNLYKYYSCF